MGVACLILIASMRATFKDVYKSNEPRDASNGNEQRQKYHRTFERHHNLRKSGDLAIGPTKNDLFMGE